MATEGLIILDIGILMGSQSPQVWQEQVDLYPGAAHLKKVVDSFDCDCGREACTREAMQHMLNEVGEGDKNAAALFIEAAQAVHAPQDLKELIHDHYHRYHEKKEATQEDYDGFAELLGRLGFSVRRL